MDNKMKMAHEFAMKLVGNPNTPLKSMNSIIEASWEYADKMQAEADKRNHIVEPNEKVGDWQPDWSQAPEWANWWAVDEDLLTAFWYEEEPVIDTFRWYFKDELNSKQTEESKDYGYQGDWRKSLRSRP